MAFHTWQFGVLLVLVVGAFWIASRQRGLRTWILLVASYAFYGFASPWFLVLLFFSTLLDYVCGLALAGARRTATRRLFLLASLIGNLGLLAFFKYSHWAAELLDPLLASLGSGVRLMDWSWSEMSSAGGWRTKLVPIGISFYTFQTLSYTIDVYRGAIPATRSLRDFALFVAFFPQLVAGPIVRAIEFLPQLELSPRFDRARLHDGLYRIGIGLAKKTLIADVLGRHLVDLVYAAPESYAPAVHVLAIYGFAFQIYYDFSGYCDIAIGAARLFGFDLPENFDVSLRSLSVREFWRRWHMTLSSWVRDYVYIPLGGSRGGEWSAARNLVITMVIIGVWHGAKMLWVYYGLLQAAAMIAERRLQARRGGGPFATTLPRKLLSWFLTFHFVVASCMLIRAADLDQVGAVLSQWGSASAVAPPAAAALAVAALIHFAPAHLGAWLRARLLALPALALGVLLGILIGILMTLHVGDTAYIYFQF